jgi:hypothetical protein
MKTFLLAAGITLTTSFIVTWGIEKIKSNSIKPGQVYKYTHGEDNPFEKPFVQINRVLEVKGDYVLYVNQEGDTSSTTSRLFMYNSKQIK